MSDLLLENFHSYDRYAADATEWISIVHGLIHERGFGDVPAALRATSSVVDLHGAVLGPGLIDLHIHGIAGVDFTAATHAEFERAADVLASHGVTGFLATTYSKPVDEIFDALGAIDRYVRTQGARGARMLGSSIEGPYFSVTRRGAHPAALLKDPDLGELARILSIPSVKIVSHAPELANSGAFIDALTRSGVVAAVGHSDATWSQTIDASNRGATLVTHVLNGMRGMHHREAGIAGAALLDDTLVCELIADGHHVSNPMIDLAWRLKGTDRIALVTDGGPAMGAPADILAGTGSRIEHGVTVTPDGVISSSITTMDSALVNFARATGQHISKVWPSASTVPARVLGLADRIGSLGPGMEGNLTAISSAGEVVFVAVGGRPVL